MKKYILVYLVAVMMTSTGGVVADHDHDDYMRHHGHYDPHYGQGGYHGSPQHGHYDPHYGQGGYHGNPQHDHYDPHYGQGGYHGNPQHGHYDSHHGHYHHDD